jgi:hypothetical protein
MYALWGGFLSLTSSICSLSSLSRLVGLGGGERWDELQEVLLLDCWVVVPVPVQVEEDVRAYFGWLITVSNSGKGKERN